MLNKKISYKNTFVGNHFTISEPYTPDRGNSLVLDCECLRCGSINILTLTQVSNGYDKRCKCSSKINDWGTHHTTSIGTLRTQSLFPVLMGKWDPTTHRESIKKLPIFAGTVGQEYIKAFTYVDKNIYTWAKHIMWIKAKLYVQCNLSRDNCARLGLQYTGCREDKCQFLHRCTNNNLDDDLVTDHTNGLTLDNRTSNLRATTLSGNGRNSRRFKGKKFKGTKILPTFSKKKGKGLAITSAIHLGRHVTLGRYESEERAAMAYDLAAMYYFGEYSKTNFSAKFYSENDYIIDEIIDYLHNKKAPVHLDKDEMLKIIKSRC